MRAQIATSSGPRYWISSAIPIAQPVDREEVEELDERDADDAEEREPRHTRPARRRSDAGVHTSANGVSPMNAPAERASVSRSDDSPDVSATFETAPLTPEERRRDEHHRVADDRPPVRGRSRLGNSGSITRCTVASDQTGRSSAW